MPDKLSIAKKRGSIIAFKASAIFILILCSLIFTHRAYALTVALPFTDSHGTYTDAVASIRDGVGDILYFNSTAYMCGDSANCGGSVAQIGSGKIQEYMQSGVYYAIEFNPPGYGSASDAIMYHCATDYTGCTYYSSGSLYLNGTPTVSIDFSSRDILLPGGSTGYTGTPPVGPCGTDTTTHICSFTPLNNATTTSPVTFSFHAYVAPQDTASPYEIQFILHNVDQNVFLLSGLSPSDIYLIDGVFATTSGAYDFSTTTTIGAGNYTLEASLTQYIGWGWASVANPLSSVNQAIYHKFIVCEIGGGSCAGTVIGNLQQNAYDILAGIAGESTGTTTATSTLATCSPISTNYATAFLNTDFSVSKCALALLTPDGKQLQTTMTQLHDGVLTRIPFGYFTRTYNLFNSTTTADLPTWTATFQTAASSTTSLTFDPGDMIAGGGTLLDSIHDPINNKTPRDVFEPMVQLSVALMVLFTIIADLMGSHRHHVNMGKNTKLS